MAVLSASAVRFLSRFSVVAGIAQALEIVDVEPRAADVDRRYVVDHLGECRDALALALLAKRGLLDLQSAKVTPRCGLIEFVVRMQSSLLDSALRHPRTFFGFLDCRHKYWDEEQEREFIFITNAMHISALQVAELYKNRWQVELFFKWIKQHLRIKRFWGTTENAVRIQIYAAICTYSLVAIIQHDMQLDRSTYEVLQILSISLTDKTYLKDLFDKTKFQNDKERFELNGPSLFNF